MNDIEQTEAYLLHTLDYTARAAFTQRLRTEPGLLEGMKLQERLYRLLRQFARQVWKRKIAAVQRDILADPAHAGFKKQIEELLPH